MINTITNKHEVIHVFPTHVQAEEAVLALEKSGFDMQKISIIGQDYQTTEHVRGFLTWKDAAQSGASGGAYWGSFFGGLFGILTGAGALFIPGMGPVVIAGPIVGVLAGWIEGTLIGGVGAALGGGIVGALVGLGIPEGKALKYETDIKAGSFMVIASGTDAEFKQAIQSLQDSGRIAKEPVAV
jgi:hypothetical protein